MLPISEVSEVSEGDPSSVSEGDPTSNPEGATKVEPSVLYQPSDASPVSNPIGAQVHLTGTHRPTQDSANPTDPMTCFANLATRGPLSDRKAAPAFTDNSYIKNHSIVDDKWVTATLTGLKRVKTTVTEKDKNNGDNNNNNNNTTTVLDKT